ncbi:unnamed protein product [Camellia sinensis]
MKGCWNGCWLLVNLLNNVLAAIPSDLNRDEWVAALPGALVAGFVKTDKDFQEKGLLECWCAGLLECLGACLLVLFCLSTELGPLLWSACCVGVVEAFCWLLP